MFAPLRAEPGSDLMLLHPDGREEDPRRRRRRCHHRSVRLLRRRIGLLRPHPQRQKGPALRSSLRRVRTSSRSTSRAGRSCELTRQDVHAQHRSRRQGIARPRRVQPRPLSAARRQGDVHQQPQRLWRRPRATRRRCCNCSSWTTTAATSSMIGHLNINCALHPTILKDGRVMFTSYESQGLRDLRNLGRLDHPSRRHQLGTALSAPSALGRQRLALHDATLRRQRRRRGILQPQQPWVSAPITRWRRRPRPANRSSAPRRGAIRATCRYHGTDYNPHPVHAARPGMADDVLHRLRRSGQTCRSERPRLAARRQGDASVRRPRQSPADRLVARSGQQQQRPEEAGHRQRHLPHQVRPAGRRAGPDAAHQERSELQRAMAARPGAVQAHPRRRRNRPACPPRATTASSPHLPEGTPFGLVGTSSLYKRESYPGGAVAEGKVTAGPDGGSTIRSRVSARLPTTRRRRATGSSRAPTPAVTTTATSTPSASSSPSRPPTRATPQAQPPLVERRQRTPAHPRRIPRAQVWQGRQDSRSIPTATPTPASWSKSPPTWPGPSRRSTRTAWS